MRLILPFNPVEARQAGGANTRRAARTMRDVSGRYMEVPSGNARPDCEPSARSVDGGPTGWPSLLTFLATQESKTRKARNALRTDSVAEPSTQKRKRPGFPGRHQDSTTRQSPGQTQNVQPMAPKLALAWSIAALHWAARAALSVTAAQLLFDCSIPCFIMSRWASGTLSAMQA